MKLRTRLFLLVGGLFLMTMVAVAIVRQLQMERSLKTAAVAIHEEIHYFNELDWQDYFAFLGVEMMKAELRINSFFEKILQFDWLEQKAEPSMMNYRTNDWSNSSVLMIANQWIDFLQTTNRDKLTSRIEMHPPFLRNFKKVVVDGGITVVIGQDNSGSLRALIGVPFWSNEANASIEAGLHEMQYTGTKNEDHWLLFSADQLSTMDVAKLKWDGIRMPTGPLEPGYDITGEKVFEELLQVTIQAIKNTKESLLKYPKLIEILTSPKLSEAWIHDRIGDYTFEGRAEVGPRCESYMCRRFAFLEQDWYQLWNWTERADQNRLIWEVATVTGSGIWDYDPLSVRAPKGIACFRHNETGDSNIGFGLYSTDAFHDQPIPVMVDCAIKNTPGKMDACISKRMQIYMAKEGGPILLLNSMRFDDIRGDEKDSGTGFLTVGVDISPVLKILALVSPDKVYFVTNDGKQVMYDTHGHAEDLSKWGNFNFKEMVAKKSGELRNKADKPYHYLYINTLTETDGHVFMIQDRDSEAFMVNELNKGVKELDKTIMVQYIIISIIALFIALVILNRIISKITKPIRNLAMATKLVAAGNYGQVHIENKKMGRKDEISQLIEAFGQMVADLKLGDEVRSILDKVVSKEIAKKILSEGIALGGEMRDVTILFSDVRNFTQISENMQPKEVLEMLNASLSILSKVIDEHEGVIDKYVGDEIMALYGAPVECKNSALKAIQCARAMRDAQNEWNKQREQSGLIPLHIGIGVHTGGVIAGNIGAENHRSYTVLGHNVNLTSRICEHAGPMEILITEAAFNSPGVKENIQATPMEPVTFKGISEPIILFKVL